MSIKPIARGDGFDLDVRFAPPSSEERARAVRDAIGDGDLLKVFADFSGYLVNREKPPVISLWDDLTVIGSE